MSVSIAVLTQRLRAEASSLAVKAANAIRSEFPEYSVVPEDELRASTLRNTLRGAQCLDLGRLPSQGDHADEPVETTSLRTAEGLRVDTIIRGYRTSLNVVHDRFISLAEELNLDPKETLAGSTLLWQLGDWFVDLSVAEYRTRTVDAAVRRSIEKSDVLHALISSTTLSQDLLDRAQALNLSLDQPYYVVMGWSGNVKAEEWVRRIERHGALGTAASIATSTARGVVGVVSRLPVEAACEAPLAVGTSVLLPDIAKSAAVAESVMAAMGRSDSGLQTLGTVSWRVAVAGHPQLDELLRNRYVDPLQNESGFGEVLLQSVWAYLELARNYRLAAQHLSVHENSLRHRINRFQELSGADLGSLDTAIELAWLKQTRSAS